MLKVKGPKSGRDYWVAVFDFIAPEVTAYQPKNVFGFSYSDDGIYWPKEHGQAVKDRVGRALRAGHSDAGGLPDPAWHGRAGVPDLLRSRRGLMASWQGYGSSKQ